MSAVDGDLGPFAGYYSTRPNADLIRIALEHRSMSTVQDLEHSDGAPTIEGTGIG